MPKPNRTVKEDQHGIYLSGYETTYRPLAINGYSHANRMDDGGLKKGDRVHAKQVSSTPMMQVTLANGQTLLWADDYTREREMQLRKEASDPRIVSDARANANTIVSPSSIRKA